MLDSVASSKETEELKKNFNCPPLVYGPIESAFVRVGPSHGKDDTNAQFIALQTDTAALKIILQSSASSGDEIDTYWSLSTKSVAGGYDIDAELVTLRGDDDAKGKESGIEFNKIDALILDKEHVDKCGVKGVVFPIPTGTTFESTITEKQFTFRAKGSKMTRGKLLYSYTIDFEGVWDPKTPKLVPGKDAPEWKDADSDKPATTTSATRPTSTLTEAVQTSQSGSPIATLTDVLPTTTPPNDQEDAALGATEGTSESSSKMHPGVIAGIVVGGVVGLVLIALVAFLLVRRRRKPEAPKKYDISLPIEKHHDSFDDYPLRAPTVPASFTDNTYNTLYENQRSTGLTSTEMFAPHMSESSVAPLNVPPKQRGVTPPLAMPDAPAPEYQERRPQSYPVRDDDEYTDVSAVSPASPLSTIASSGRYSGYVGDGGRTDRRGPDWRVSSAGTRGSAVDINLDLEEFDIDWHQERLNSFFIPVENDRGMI